MTIFEVSMIVSSTSTILIMVLLLIIRTMPSREGIGWWTASATTQAFTYLLAFFFHNEEQSVGGEVIVFCLLTATNHLFIMGTLLFIGKETSKSFWLFTPLVMLATVSGLLIMGQQFAGQLLFAVENSAAFAYVTVAIFKSDTSRNSTKVLGGFSGAVALHWLDYPFFAHDEFLKAIGFFIGMVLSVGLFMSLSALALLQFREHTKRSEKRAIYSATHDPLTGLYNRNHLDTLFDQYVENALESNLPFAVLYLDLDGFKAVNDKYGHKAGDMLLVTVAKRLEKWLGTRGDAIRIGGDEIIVLCRFRREYSELSAYQSARLLLDMIELPIVDGENVYRVSSSIGGCSYRPGTNTSTLDEMINCSDKQMYKAKQAGGHCIFFPERLDRDSPQVIDGGFAKHRSLRRALDRQRSKRLLAVA